MAVNRISGLASGIDYETMIKDLMKVEKAPVDKLNQQKQIYQWQQEIFRDINTSLLSLKTEAFNMKLSSAYKIFNTSSSDTTVVTASGTSGAVGGTYKITVTQLAKTAEKKNTVTSPDLKSNAGITVFDMSGKDFYITFEGVQKHISWNAAPDGAYADITALKDGLQQKVNDAFGSNQITVSIVDGDRIKFSAANTTYKSNITLNDGTTVNALADLHFDNYARSQISVDTQLKDLKFADYDGDGNATTLDTLTFDTDNKLKFSINGKSFELNNTDTLQTLFTTVNSDPDADVTMGYDTAKDIIYIRRKSSGAGKDITFTDGTGSNFSAAVGLGATTLGQNAKFDFTDDNGLLTQNIEKASNSFTMAGLNISLLKEDPGVEKVITVSKDVNAVYDKIKAFVDKYNETIDKINTKLSEKKDYDYQPLTDEQKQDMKDSEIELWEEKAKSGLVSGDSILQSVVRDLRYSMNNEVPGLNASYNQLREFGIKTGGYQDNGKLYIDETKLKQVISEHPDEVLNFFSYNPSDLKGNTLSGVIDVNTKDFKVTMNGTTQTITLSGSYDLSTSDGKTNLVKEINNKLTDAFGYGSLVASFSSENRLVLASSAGNTFTLNSGPINDALATLGFVDGSTYDSSKKGVIAKVYDKLNIGINKIMEKAGSSSLLYDISLIGDQIKRLNSRIGEANDRLTQIEDRYYKQFIAMETALNRMNSQSAWLSQQFGGQ